MSDCRFGVSPVNYPDPVPLYTGTQLEIAIIDARSIANAYYYGVSYARSGLLRMRRFTSRALER